MRVIDSLPHVLAALDINGPTGQTDLTVITWGTSGRGAPKLTQGLFPYMEEKGLIQSHKRGRTIVYQLTGKGRQALVLVQMDPIDRKALVDGIAQQRADGDIR